MWKTHDRRASLSHVSRVEPRANRRQKGVISARPMRRCGGSQARTTAPDLRSGLAGVHGFKSLARTARSGKSHPPHLACARGKPLRKTFIRGEWLAAAEEGSMHGFSKTTLLVLVGLAMVAAMLAAPLSRAAPSVGPSPAGAVTIPLYGSFAAPAGWGWTANNITEPGPTLKVRQGDVITFQLFSNDTMLHQLIIDLDNSHSQTPGDQLSVSFSSKATATVFTYTASTVGTFAYFCNIHGYNAQHGQLVVNGPPSAPSSLAAAAGNAQVVLTWQAPASHGGSAVTGYQKYRCRPGWYRGILSTRGQFLT